MDNYSINVAWSDEDGGYIATVPEFDDVSAFGETPAEALREVLIALEECVEVYKEEGIPLPVPSKRSPYSGQLRLRMPRTLHGKLAVMAEKEGVSLNQLMVSMLSEACGYRRALKTSIGC